MILLTEDRGKGTPHGMINGATTPAQAHVGAMAFLQVATRKEKNQPAMREKRGG